MGSSAGPRPLPAVQRALQWLLWLAMDQWFLIALAVIIVISSQVQVPLDKQNLRQTIVTYGGVAVIFLITGLTLKTGILIENYARWRVHLFIQFQCFLMTSAIVFGVVSAAASNRDFMDEGLLVGMILLGCLPTTLSSNVVMTSQAHGNTALTVVQTTIGNFLSPFLTPALFKMYLSSGAWYTHFLDDTSDGGFGEVYRRVFKQLGLSVYVPMVAGQIIQYLFPRAVETLFVKYKLKKLSSISLLAVIWQTFDQAFATGAFRSVDPSNIIFIVFISIAFYGLWLTICFLTSIPWLPKRDTIAVCYCVPAKTPAIGVPLANVLYAGLGLLKESKLQIPMIIFQGLQVTFSSLLTIGFRRWIQPEEEREAAGEETLTGNSEDCSQKQEAKA